MLNQRDSLLWNEDGKNILLIKVEADIIIRSRIMVVFIYSLIEIKIKIFKNQSVNFLSF